LLKMNDDPKKWRLYESAMIKSIRRGLVDDAIYWGTRLYLLGHAEGVWRRLFIHASEDVGPVDRTLPANLVALYGTFKRLQYNRGDCAYEAEHTDRLPFVHAMLVATAPKSRAVDNAIVVHFECPEHREVPDYATDFHSPKGRRMGRGIQHFLDEAAMILDEIPGDEWKAKARRYLLQKDRTNEESQKREVQNPGS
jgi:replication-associated recombination protein RarA